MQLLQQQNAAISPANFAGITYSSNAFLKLFDQTSWIINSGASDHICCNIALFSTINTLKQPLRIGLPDGNIKYINQIGSVQLTPSITLYNVLFVPDFKHNLLSIGRLLDHNKLIACFHSNSCSFQDLTTNEVRAIGRRQSGLYKFSDDSFESNSLDSSTAIVSHVSSSSSKFVTLDLLHARLGHMSINKMKHLPISFAGDSLNFSCECCILAKHHKFPFQHSHNKAAHIFYLLHIDLCGPYKTPTISGATYFQTILDDCSRTTWTHLVHNKAQVAHIIKHFLAYVSTQFNATVKAIRTDNGTEVIKEFCHTLFAEKGIIHRKSLPGVPQQNGRVERKHKHLLETARAMRFKANLPVRFWGDCLLAATYLMNLTPSSVLQWKTPYELLFHKVPSYDHLKVLGCLCFAAVKTNDKLAPRARRCLFLGYPYGQKGYKLFDLTDQKVILSRDVIFHEHIFPYNITPTASVSSSDNTISSFPSFNPITFDTNFASSSPVSSSSCPITNTNSPSSLTPITNTNSPSTLVPPINTDTSSPSHSNDHSSPRLRKSTRQRQSPSKLHDYVVTDVPQPVLPDNSFSSTFNVFSEPHLASFDPDYLATLHNVLNTQEPANYSQAKSDPDWVHAMQLELQALEQNNTWELTELPPGHKAIGCQWVYKTKYKPDGSVERLKARLVARGDKQIKRKDFKHTFSPVAKFTTVRTIIALAASKNWHLHQVDINNAFLHGYIQEELYMQPPPGYSTAAPGQVCKLKRSLYGLKQASRQWNLELTKFLVTHGFTQSKHDYSMFTKGSGNQFTVVIAYVDDLLIVGTDLSFIQHLKQLLHQAFTIKDLGELKYFLGLEVLRSSDGFYYIRENISWIFLDIPS
ncbi:Retrovirus-related Pol polyprotein from transposon TNT 1-94 [Bienertia sinuspersici]